MMISMALYFMLVIFIFEIVLADNVGAQDFYDVFKEYIIWILAVLIVLPFLWKHDWWVNFTYQYVFGGEFEETSLHNTNQKNSAEIQVSREKYLVEIVCSPKENWRVILLWIFTIIVLISIFVFK